MVSEICVLDYTPAYIYILTFIAKTGLNPLLCVKTVSVLFEFLSAFYLWKIVSLKIKNKLVIPAVFAVALSLPAIVINSSYWAQCDSIYTSFAIASVYFFLKKQQLKSVIFLGFAFAFKLQTAVLLPFYFVAMLRGNIKWYCFVAVPVIYFLGIIPAWLAGRPLMDLLGIYFLQANKYKMLTMNFPNIYIWANNDLYEPLKMIGIVATCSFTLILGIILKKKSIHFNYELWLRLMFLSAICVPFLLPGMHERYMYIGDIVGVAYACIFRQKCYLPFGIWTVSTYSYIRLSYLYDLLPMYPAFFLYLVIILLVIFDFYDAVKKQITI